MYTLSLIIDVTALAWPGPCIYTNYVNMHHKALCSKFMPVPLMLLINIIIKTRVDILTEILNRMCARTDSKNNNNYSCF